MLVVGGADDYGVDVLVGEEVAVVGIAGDAVVGLAGLFGVVVVDELLAFFNSMASKVADCDDAGAIDLEDVGHVVATGDAADADGSYVDAIAGGHLTEDGGRDDSGEASDGSGSQGRL